MTETTSQFAVDRDAFYARLEEKSARLKDDCYMAKLQLESAISRLHRAVSALEAAGAGGAEALINLSIENLASAKSVIKPHAK